MKKYFGTDGIRGPVGGSKINPIFVMKLAYAAGRVFSRYFSNQVVGSDKPYQPTVLIGKDTRISGYMLEAALEAGFVAAGVNVVLVGPVPSPAVAYLTKTLRLTAGVVISASHNHYSDNGVKFFTADGFKLDDELEYAIESELEKEFECVPSGELGKATRLVGASERYIEFCKSRFSNKLSLHGLTLVVDAANGAAYKIAPAVFRELGANVISVGCEPNGLNINEGVGALHPEFLLSKVKEYQADYGIALDGDADRIQMVDSHGHIYNGDELLYAVIKDRLCRDEVPGVVGTLMTNMGLEVALKSRGISVERANVGDRHVIEKLREKGWLYGGETSGHLLLLDKHYAGDGVVAALQVLMAVVRHKQPLSEWISDLALYTQHMINLQVTESQKASWSQNTEFLEEQARVKTILGDEGRVLIRPSGTEPKVRIMVESKDSAKAKQYAEHLAKAFTRLIVD